ncbi:hypothetical protein LINPERPRIM_LOCUS26104, partial [Linum perenne]
MEKASIKLSCFLVVFLVISNGVILTMGGGEGEIDRATPSCPGCPRGCLCNWNGCRCPKGIRPSTSDMISSNIGQGKVKNG